MLITVVWCAIVSVILFMIVDMVIGPAGQAEQEEPEGLDQPTHGELRLPHLRPATIHKTGGARLTPGPFCFTAP